MGVLQRRLNARVAPRLPSGVYPASTLRASRQVKAALLAIWCAYEHRDGGRLAGGDLCGPFHRPHRGGRRAHPHRPAAAAARGRAHPSQPAAAGERLPRPRRGRHLARAPRPPRRPIAAPHRQAHAGARPARGEAAHQEPRIRERDRDGGGGEPRHRPPAADRHSRRARHHAPSHGRAEQHARVPGGGPAHGVLRRGHRPVRRDGGAGRRPRPRAAPRRRVGAASARGPSQPVDGRRGAAPAAAGRRGAAHWGTLYPPWLPPAFNARFGRWPVAFTRYAAHLAPGVDVRVLGPGETTRIDGVLRERAVP